MGSFKALIEGLVSSDVQKIENGEKVNLKGIDFDSSEILVFRSPKAGTQAVTNRFITIDMECKLDQELIDEGLAREMVNRIQKTRKDMNFNVADRIAITIQTNENLERIFKKFENYIASETLVTSASFSKTEVAGSMLHEIDEERVSIKATKS